jgi:hypothetical protein
LGYHQSIASDTRTPQGAIRLRRLGYFIAKDPHIVRRVIGGSAY